MSVVATTDDVDHVALRREIDAALEDGIVLSSDEVVGIWHLAEALPHLRTRRVFLEMGEQQFDEATSNLTHGKGWLHILAKHAEDFVGKGFDQGEIFNHLSEALLTKEVHSSTGSRQPCIYYLEDATTGPYLLAMALGTNGYMVTTYPKPLFRKTSLKNLKSKRERALSVHATTSKADIVKSANSALLVSQNVDCILMWKNSIAGGMLEYFDAEEFVCGPLVKAIANYGAWNRDIAMEGWRNTEEEQWHEIEGLRIALSLKELRTEKVFYETARGKIFLISETVAKGLFRRSLCEVFQMLRDDKFSSSAHGSSSPVKPALKKGKLNHSVNVDDDSPVFGSPIVITHGAITSSAVYEDSLHETE